MLTCVRPVEACLTLLSVCSLPLPDLRPTVLVCPSLHWPCPARLRQCGFRLREPEMHLHGMVQRDGSGQRSARLLPLACPGVQRAEAEVTVRLKRPHAEFLGQGEGL